MEKNCIITKSNGVNSESAKRTLSLEDFRAIKANACAYACEAAKRKDQYEKYYNKMMVAWFEDFVACSDENWNKKLRYLDDYKPHTLRKEA